MDYKTFSSNRSILQSFTIHPIIATADKSGHFVPVGFTSAFVGTCLAMELSRKLNLADMAKIMDMHFLRKF